MSHEKVAEEKSNSDSDAETIPSGTLEEYSKSKPLTKFTYITKKVYKDDDSEEIIYDFKNSDLHLDKLKEEQDPIIKLNLLSKKERKNVDDLHDYFKSTKSIEDFEELNNDMMYHVQEIFFILHRGHGMDYLARTFRSFLIVEVDKRNLNPLKQMRLIEQRRQ
nr:hypothetical protein [Tanacetum cinerariifolium]